MFKAIANWFKGLFGKAEQQVAKDKQIADSFETWKEIVTMAKAQETTYPVVAEETVAPAKKSTQRKTSAKTTKTSAKTSKAPAQKAAPKSKTSKTTK